MFWCVWCISPPRRSGVVRLHSNSIASRIDRGELGQVIRVAVIRDDAGAVDVDVRVSMKLKYSVDAGIVASHHDCR